MADEKTALKPCPFCGGTDVEIRQDHVLICGNRLWYIRHMKSNGKCPLVNGFGDWTSSVKFTTKEKAIEAWNRRATDG